METHKYKCVPYVNQIQVFHDELLNNLKTISQTFINYENKINLQKYCIMQSLLAIKESHPEIYEAYEAYIDENNLVFFLNKDSMPGILNINTKRCGKINFSYKHSTFQFFYLLFFVSRKVKQFYEIIKKLLIPVILFTVLMQISNAFVSCLFTTIAFSSLCLNKEWIQYYIPAFWISNLTTIALFALYALFYSFVFKFQVGEVVVQTIFGIGIGFSYFTTLFRLVHDADKQRTLSEKISRTLFTLLFFLITIALIDLTFSYIQYVNSIDSAPKAIEIFSNLNTNGNNTCENVFRSIRTA